MVLLLFFRGLPVKISSFLLILPFLLISGMAFNQDMRKNANPGKIYDEKLLYKKGQF
jgi:hypothetical protein